MIQEVSVHVLSPRWNVTSLSQHLVPGGSVSRRSLFSRKACSVHLAQGDRCGAFACQPRSCRSLSRQNPRVSCRGLARSLFHLIVLLGKETFSRTPHHVERASIQMETRASQGTSSFTGGCIPEVNHRISTTPVVAHPVG